MRWALTFQVVGNKILQGTIFGLFVLFNLDSNLDHWEHQNRFQYSRNNNLEDKSVFVMLTQLVDYTRIYNSVPDRISCKQNQLYCRQYLCTCQERMALTLQSQPDTGNLHHRQLRMCLKQFLDHTNGQLGMV